MTQAPSERRRNGLPVGGAAAGPWWRRVLTSRWTWVGVLMTAAYAVALALQLQIIMAPVKVEGAEVPGINASALREAAGYAWPTLAVWVALFVLLDRFRPQRPLFWWLALGWGGTVATGLSLVLNTWAAEQMQIAGGPDPSQGARAAIFVAPFVEEATKASVLFLIALAYRYRLVSKITGIVLGGLSAAGFAFTENIIYYARAIVFSSVNIDTGDPEAAVRQLVMLRGVLLSFGHPLFTMLTGIGLMVALRTRSKLVRVLAPLVGFLGAALLHMLFNSGASLVGQQQQVLIYFLVVLPLVLGAVVWVLRQLPVEGRRHRARLNDFVRAGWLSDADAYVFARQRSRWRALLVALARGRRPFWATLSMQRAVTELVYLRDAQTRGVVDAAGTERAHELLVEIERLRPLAVADPRGARISLPDVRAWWARVRPRRTAGALTGVSPDQRALTPQATPVYPPLGSPAQAVEQHWLTPRPLGAR